MDMQLNKETLKHEREKRAWSQSHLAEVAGLSLRTVQRIERTGSASLDSAKAIASAFDKQVDQMCIPLPISGSRKFAQVPLFATACMSVLLIITWWSNAFAEPIMLNLSVSTHDKNLADVQLLNENGEQSELQIDGILKVKLTPSVSQGKVILSTQIYEFVKDNYELKAEPQLVTNNKMAAEIHFDAENGEVYQLLIEPHL